MIVKFIVLLIFIFSIFSMSYMIVFMCLKKFYIQKRLLLSLKNTMEEKFSKKSKPHINALSHFKNRLSSLAPSKTKEDMQIMLVLSGSKYSVEDILLIKLLLVVPALFVDYLIFKNLQMNLYVIMLIIIFPLVLVTMPNFLLKRKVKLRRKSIKKALPSFIDYLGISVDAGLGLDTAILRVINRTAGPLSEELAYAMTEIQYGKPRKEAFENLSSRLKLPELGSFLTAVVNAEHLGISIGNILKIQGQQLRQKRKQETEEYAYKMSIKLLFPLVFFILPSLFIILLGPAAIQVFSALIK